MHHIIGLIPFLPAIAVIGLITVAFLWLLGALLIAALKWRRERRAPATRQKKFPKRIGLWPFHPLPRGVFLLLLAASGLGSVVGLWFVFTDQPDEDPIVGVSDSRLTDRPQSEELLFQISFANRNKDVAATKVDPSLTLIVGEVSTNPPAVPAIGPTALLPGASNWFLPFVLSEAAYRDVMTGKKPAECVVTIRYRSAGWDRVYRYRGIAIIYAKKLQAREEWTTRLGWRPWR
jgi:hypothetical protein